MENTTTNPQPVYATADPVPVPVAAAQTANWRAFMKQNLPAGITPIKAFFIPIDDLNALRGFAINGIRVYFALKEPENPNTLHLMVVPVDGSGNDLITVNGSSVIYDTTLPCPTLCSSANPINTDQ